MDEWPRRGKSEDDGLSYILAKSESSIINCPLRPAGCTNIKTAASYSSHASRNSLLKEELL